MDKDTKAPAARSLENAQEIIETLYANGASMAETIDSLRADRDEWKAKAGCLAPPRPPSADHPGGPLSRAERVVLSNLRNGAMRARALVGGMSHILGAIPGAQKIEAAHVEAVAAIDRLLMVMKLRKQGAPYPPGDAWGDASEGEPSE